MTTLVEILQVLGSFFLGVAGRVGLFLVAGIALVLARLGRLGRRRPGRRRRGRRGLCRMPRRPGFPIPGATRRIRADRQEHSEST